MDRFQSLILEITLIFRHIDSQFGIARAGETVDLAYSLDFFRIKGFLIAHKH